MAEDPQPLVVYTVKELFIQVNEQLIKIDSKLDTKANHADVVDLDKRVNSLEKLRILVIGLLIGAGINGAYSLLQIWNLLHR